jgi:hypothetical protein
MALLSRHPWYAASLLLVPVLTLAAPGWPRLAGVGLIIGGVALLKTAS